MRETIKIKKSEVFYKAIKVSDKRKKIIDAKVMEFLAKEPPMTYILQSFWNNSDEYTNNELVYIIFELGQAKCRKDTSDFANQLSKKVLPQIMGRFT